VKCHVRALPALRRHKVSSETIWDIAVVRALV
jgi:hypothetical protein